MPERSERNGYNYGNQIITLEKNAKVYLKLTTSYSSCTVTVERIQPIDLSNGENMITFDKYGHKWLLYKATETGLFTIDSDKSFYCYNADKTYADYKSSFSQFVDAGATMYIRFYGDTGYEYTFTVGLEKLVPLTANADSETVELKPGATKLYQFTAAEAGRYAITQKNSSVNIDLYTDMESIGSSRSKSADAHMLSMSAEQTVYLVARNNRSETASVTLNVAKGDSEADIAITKGRNYVEKNTSGDIWLTFTAEESGTYIFSYTSGNVYYYGQDKTSNQGSVNGKIINLAENDKVYMRLTSSSTITVQRPMTLTVDTPVETSVEVSGDSWLEFTAPSDGTYRFYSSNVEGDSSSLDTKAVLYKDGIKVDENDDGGVGNHFLIEYSLQANNIVYLDTFDLGRNQAITYMVYAEKVETAEPIE